MQNRECIVFEQARDADQRIHELCVFVSAVFIPSSTNHRVDHFHPTQSLSHFFCPLEFFIACRLEK